MPAEVSGPPITCIDVEGSAPRFSRRSRSVRRRSSSTSARSSARTSRSSAIGWPARFTVEDLFTRGRALRPPRRRARSRGVARQPAETVTADRYGVLCWDLFDFLDNTTGKALATRLAEHAAARRRVVRLLRHDAGRAHALHPLRRFRDQLRRWTCPATGEVARERAADPRHQPDVRGPGVAESVLLKSQHPRDPVPQALTRANAPAAV